PVPSRKELAARLESLLGAVLQEYALEGKKNRKLTEKAAGQLAKAFRKNAKKREAKKAAAPAPPAGTPKQPQSANLANPL
ncbi:MAG: hypothetical protein ICV83_24145, partial [Cytophagales bacterium]|nr:hypothetical protein [Cytophagales bacterium]